MQHQSEFLSEGASDDARATLPTVDARPPLQLTLMEWWALNDTLPTHPPRMEEVLGALLAEVKAMRLLGERWLAAIESSAEPPASAPAPSSPEDLRAGKA